MPSRKSPRISLIGAGVVGTTLIRALGEKGYTVVSVISRSAKPALELARSVKCRRVSSQIADVSSDSEIILIATPDASIPGIAKELANVKKLKFKNLLVVHTSGVHSSSVLEPLRRKGAAVASMHPVQTFPSFQRPSELRSKLKGIFYGVDGDKNSMPRVEQLVKSVGGTPVEVPAELRSLYHAACVFASGYLMVILNAISRLGDRLRFKASWTEVFGPLMTTAMGNAIRYPVADVMTGPILRNDAATIGAHLSALAEYAPEFLPLYMINGAEVGRIAHEKGRISREELEALLKSFRKFVKEIPSTTTHKVKR